MEQITMQLPVELQNVITETVKNALDVAIKDKEKKNQYPPYMNQKQASMYLHIAPATLIKWEKQNKDFPTISIDGVKRYQKTSLDKWMQAREK